MTFGLVNLDFSSFYTDVGSVIEIGADDADAKRGGSFRSRPSSRPRASKPRASKPKPRAAKPAPSATKPKAKKTDAATKAAKRQQSQRKAIGTTSKPTIKSSSGKPIKVAGTPAAKSVRKMSPDKYASRGSRRDARYSNIQPAQRTVIVNQYGGGFFGDPFSGLFMYSLLSSSLHHQAMFHHHHWNSYSAQRQQALVAENAQLKAEMASMAGTPRDPNYAPEGTDADLMYTDEFVDAAYNPVEKESNGLLTFFLVVLGLGGLVACYLIFLRRTPTPTVGT
jgi:hypothetical protein